MFECIHLQVYLTIGWLRTKISKNFLKNQFIKSVKLHTFCPIMLFHEHSYKDGNVNVEKCIIITQDNDNEHHTQFILSHKERVEKMMCKNSQFWENARGNYFILSNLLYFFGSKFF